MEAWMEDVTRKRILRKLEALPDEQLYQVLDYIEFIEAKYAAAALRKPDALQQFAERLEDQMRVRALAPRAMRGTMKLVSQATRVLDGVRDFSRDLVAAPERSGAEPAGSGRAEPEPSASERPGSQSSGPKRRAPKPTAAEPAAAEPTGAESTAAEPTGPGPDSPAAGGESGPRADGGAGERGGRA